MTRQNIILLGVIEIGAMIVALSVGRTISIAYGLSAATSSDIGFLIGFLLGFLLDGIFETVQRRSPKDGE